jgi:hypothetical protein
VNIFQRSEEGGSLLNDLSVTYRRVVFAEETVEKFVPWQVGYTSGFFAVGLTVDSDAKCNPVDSIGSSTKSRVSHSERRPSARFPGDKDGSARRNIEPLQ